MVGPGSSRDGIWGVVFGAVMGLRLRSPPSWVSGVDQPPRAAITTPGHPAGYLRFPGPDQTVIVGPYQVDRTSRAGQGTRAQARHEGPSALRRVLQKDSVWGYGDQVGSRVPDGRAE